MRQLLRLPRSKREPARGLGPLRQRAVSCALGIDEDLDLRADDVAFRLGGIHRWPASAMTTPDSVFVLVLHATDTTNASREAPFDLDDARRSQLPPFLQTAEPPSS